MDDLTQFFDLVADLDIVLPTFIFLHEGNLTAFLSHFQNVEGVLLLDLHHGSSELNPLVEVLENLLFYGLDVFFLVYSPTVSTNSILPS